MRRVPRGRQLPGPRWLHLLRRRLTWVLILILVIPAMFDGLIGLRHKLADADRSCRVVQVVDGDTIGLWCGGTGVARARLTGFDAPELFSPACIGEVIAAQKAKWALRLMLLQAADLQLSRKGTDRYGRGLVALMDGAEPLAQQMIAAGHGRAYGGGRRDGWCEGV